MGIIYLTENLYNKSLGIKPWRYIGSDQNNNPEYLGSNEQLRKDIASIGSVHFIKTVLEDCGDIDNKSLRRIESEKYLKPNDVKKDDSYYNKTDIYGAGGGVKGMKHSKPRSNEHIEKIKKHRTGSIKNTEAREKMRIKKIGKKLSQKTRQKMSFDRQGEKNSNALNWYIVTPTGEIYNVKGLRKWASDNGFNYYTIYGQKNGWTAIKNGTGRGGKKKKELSSDY